MNYIQKIKRLYGLSEKENYGFSEEEILAVEKDLEITFPKKLKEYYLELGKEENLNFSFNRLLKPDDEIEFSDDNSRIYSILVSGTTDNCLLTNYSFLYFSKSVSTCNTVLLI